jgi:hypothetical protein
MPEMCTEHHRPEARLYRSRVAFAEEIDHFTSEPIGEGTLDKMLRLALSDPDGELWRYSIKTSESLICGDHILRLSGGNVKGYTTLSSDGLDEPNK